MAHGASELAPAAVDSCRVILEQAMADNGGVVFALLATVDGMAVTWATAPGWDVTAERVAAMASSGHALGDTLAGEIGAEQCNGVIIPTDRLSVVFLAVPDSSDPPLILGLAATSQESLGSVLHAARSCVHAIRDNLVAA